MNHQTRIEKWILEDSNRITALKHASTLELTDWCLAAGFVRNLVWDNLYRDGAPTKLNDIDLIYFDSSAPNKTTDKNYQSQLCEISGHPWSVKNQARMHARNHDQPYLSTSDAMSYWPEVETAVGVRLTKDHDLEFLAPFGLEPLFQGTITLNRKRPKPKEFVERVERKNWLERWSGLKVVIQAPIENIGSTNEY